MKNQTEKPIFYDGSCLKSFRANSTSIKELVSKPKGKENELKFPCFPSYK